MPKTKQEIENIAIEITNNILKTDPKYIIGNDYGSYAAINVADFMETLISRLSQKSDKLNNVD